MTWVGVQGATAYRVSWRRTDGGPVVGWSLTASDLTPRNVLFQLMYICVS